MNIVKIAGLVILTIVGINIYTDGSWLVTVPLAVVGTWVWLIGGLSA